MRSSCFRQAGHAATSFFSSCSWENAWGSPRPKVVTTQVSMSNNDIVRFHFSTSLTLTLFNFDLCTWFVLFACCVECWSWSGLLKLMESCRGTPIYFNTFVSLQQCSDMRFPQAILPTWRHTWSGLKSMSQRPSSPFWKTSPKSFVARMSGLWFVASMRRWAQIHGLNETQTKPNYSGVQSLEGRAAKGKPLISREWLKALLREPGRTVLRWYCVDLSTLPWHLITCEDGGWYP